MATQKIRADTQIEGAVGGNSFSDAEGDPTKVAGTAADGTSTYAARRDHIHDGSWVVIEDIDLGADTATFDFQSIPSTFRHLKIEFSGRSSRSATSDNVKMRFNNDSGSNYVGLIQWGAGQVETTTATTPTDFTFITGSTSPANWFNNAEITVFNYATANTYKSWQSRGMQTITNSAGNFFIYDSAGLYLSLTSISRITLYLGTGPNFKQYSRVTLYGMK